MKYTSFEEMPVWQNAMDVAVQIFTFTNGLPRSEDYGLTSQIRRSGLSISANIAEGFGRSTNADKARFYIISRGSAYETLNHLIYGTRVAYFEKDPSDLLSDKIRGIVQELNKLIKVIASQPQPQPQPKPKPKPSS